MIRRPPRSTLFPTRRSSDLSRRATLGGRDEEVRDRRHPGERARMGRTRSEEHTSELQSHVNLVCRLLLEKKKKKTGRTYNGRQLSTSELQGIAYNEL